jgi:hypothetical protein
MTSDPSLRWLLAFDATCQTCQSIADAVAEASGGRLDVVPLRHPQVAAWREQAIDADAPSRPTLLRVENEHVRAWTSTAMVIPLVRRLGLRATTRVVAALGELKHQAKQVSPIGQPPNADGMTRKHFLRMAGGGIVVATGIITGTGMSAFAAQRAVSARTWVEQNLGHLPQQYDEVAALPEHYRRAVFQASTPQVQTRLLLDHLAHRRTAATKVTTRQAQLFDEVSAYLEELSHSAAPAAARPDDRLTRLEAEVLAAFDRASAIATFGTLGPVSESTVATRVPQCECSVGSKFAHCQACVDWIACNNTYKGCGFLLQYDCTGMCAF